MILENEGKCKTVLAIIVSVVLVTAVITSWAADTGKFSPDSSASGVLLAIVGALLAMLNGVGLFIMVGMRQDLKDIWDRMYGHEHLIECSNKTCTATKTSAVMVPHQRR